MAFFELRQYRMRPGQRDAWVKLMEEEIVPFQTSKGMVICAMFCGEEDKDLYVWIRRFESEAERERLYEAVYQTDHWKNDIGPRVGDLIDREQCTLVGLAARIADEAGAAAHQGDWGVAESLQPDQAHDRQQGAHVQTRRRRVEADIGRHLRGREHRVETFRAVVEQPAPTQFVENVHAHHYTRPRSTSTGCANMAARP